MNAFFLKHKKWLYNIGGFGIVLVAFHFAALIVFALSQGLPGDGMTYDQAQFLVITCLVLLGVWIAISDPHDHNEFPEF